MINLGTAISSSLVQMEQMMGSKTITWNGNTYVCLPSSHGKQMTLDEGGFAITADIIVNVRKSLFTTSSFPEPQDTFVYSGKTYRVVTARVDATDTFYRLVSVDASRGV